ncbi:hypothetical protein [Mycolicibacterium arabiense]|uniref:hypothetical protein n=1 Tax=Mycolicibacterium arabiense TaxID=1286181 RepID=UPI001F3E0160|nr:hypothetical protein [Mycolicibacterium arabiense]
MAEPAAVKQSGQRVLIRANGVPAHGLDRCANAKRHGDVEQPHQPERGDGGGEVGVVGQPVDGEGCGAEGDDGVEHEYPGVVEERHVPAGDGQDHARQGRDGCAVLSETPCCRAEHS